ncbi:hypothetical protein NEF87_003068 [Candidatus Lokiarchaeum ossiferum]|uniref:Uncharacterized protein n=1 Tax=Candidatus Lokiarchaeum ossiferum TaxID=2951803 RepID=A0ABY6HTD4_9ARCH|nr:hypothetical protein NEF87_003068 [Candidatus Lokiarchaeum sp. B-35]
MILEQIHLGTFEGITQLIAVIPLIFILGFFSYFTYQAIKTRFRMYYHLMLLFFFSTTNLVFSFLLLGRTFGFIPENELIFSDSIVIIISQIFDLFALLDVLVLLLIFEQSKNTLKTLLPLVIILAMILGALFSNHESFSTGSGIILQGFTLISILILIFSVLASMVIGKIFLSSFRMIESGKQRHLFLNMIIGISLSQLFGGVLPFTLEVFSEDSVGRVSGIFSFIKIFGLMSVGYAFLRVSKNPWLMERQKNHFLLIYSTSGLLLFSKSFRKDITQDNMSLFSGAFSAITIMLKETTKIDESIKMIQYENKEMHVVTKEHFICVLMQDYSTQASQNALKEFVNDFETKFAENLSNFTGNITPFSESKIIAEKYFTY